MHNIKLTKIQLQWLTHVNNAQDQCLSMSAYAKQNGLALKSFYNARSVLMEKGAVKRPVNNGMLLPVNIDNQLNNTALAACRISLPNGVIVDTAYSELDVILKAVSLL